MFCRNCGRLLGQGAQFCANCGAAVPVPLQPKNKNHILLTLIVGFALLLGGVLPLILRLFGSGSAELAHRLLMEGHSYLAVSALSALQNFANLGSFLFTLPCCGLAVLSGTLLLKGRSNAGRTLTLTAVYYGLSLLRTAVVMLVLLLAPGKALSLFLWDPDAISMGEELLRSESGLVFSLIPNFWIRLILDLGLLALCILALAKCRQPATGPKYTTPGIPMLLAVLPLLQVFSTVFVTAMISAYGDMAVAAHSIATAAFSRYIGTTFALFLCAWIFLTVFFPEVKRWVQTLPVLGIVLFFCALALLLSKPLLEAYSPPEETYAMALSRLRGMILTASVLLIALFLWFSAAAKQRLPGWLQVLIPALLPVICFFWEGIAVAGLQLTGGFSIGCFRCAWILTALSLLVRRKKAIG